MNHTDIINYLIKQNNYNSYLEIGLDDGRCFVFVECENKYCVDPFTEFKDLIQNEDMIPPCLTWRMTSDELFAQTEQKFDIIFVDGMHKEDFAGRDIINGLKHLNKGGRIVVHDCIPLNYEAQLVTRIVGGWNGDVWKAITMLHEQGIEFKTVDTDCGCCIIEYHKNPQDLVFPNKSKLTYDEMIADRDNILHVISVEEFLELYKKQL